jgi:hypothetical protein
LHKATDAGQRAFVVKQLQNDTRGRSSRESRSTPIVLISSVPTGSKPIANASEIARATLTAQ